jgi:hypothetical protein
MNKKSIVEDKNLNMRKLIKERAISKKDKNVKSFNKSYKSFSNIQYNTNNKSNESNFDKIYKTIFNGSLKNLKNNEKNLIIKKK